MLNFIHISDLHTHGKMADNTAVFRKLTNIRKNLPDFHVIITGDITDDGDEKQYENAYNMLKYFKGRLHICPGNHDFGRNGLLYDMEKAKRYFKFSEALGIGSGFVDNLPMMDFINGRDFQIRIISLNSNLDTKSPFDFARGEIGSLQLSCLQSALGIEYEKKTFTILIMHHHPIITHDPLLELIDKEQFWQVVYGKFDLLLFGHKHEYGRWGNKISAGAFFEDESSPKIIISKNNIEYDNIYLG
jgi:3',5'-cyclic AMP phosphodiesterase CpdA